MITIPQEHYRSILGLVQSLSKNFTLLLHSKERGLFEKVLADFEHAKTKIQDSDHELTRQSEKQKLVLMQYESQLGVLRQKSINQQETIKSHEAEMTRLRQQLSRLEKQGSKLKQLSKQLKGEKVEKELALSEMQEQFKSQIKSIKREYKEENKHLKQRVKQLEELLQTAIATGNSQQMEMELDRELEELKRYQQQ